MNQEALKHTTFESYDQNNPSVKGELVTSNQSSKENHPAQVLINHGLCTSCCNLGECIWEENNKIYCEHYQ
jgi:hypothetical protein